MAPMTDSQRRELDAFLKDQEEIGGVVPSKLAHGTELFIDTDKFLFKATVDKSNGTPKFIIDTGAPIGDRICVCIGSHHKPLKYDRPDYIGLDMSLVLRFSNGSNILSGVVFGVSIKGEGYDYELWENVKAKRQVEAEEAARKAEEDKQSPPS